MKKDLQIPNIDPPPTIKVGRVFCNMVVCLPYLIVDHQFLINFLP